MKPPAWQRTLRGFSGGDTIDIASLAFSSSYTTSYKGTKLTIDNGTKPVFTFANIDKLGSFTLTDDGSGGTMVACYLEGTLQRPIPGKSP